MVRYIGTDDKTDIMTHRGKWNRLWTVCPHGLVDYMILISLSRLFFDILRFNVLLLSNQLKRRK